MGRPTNGVRSVISAASLNGANGTRTGGDALRRAGTSTGRSGSLVRAGAPRVVSPDAGSRNSLSRLLIGQSLGGAGQPLHSDIGAGSSAHSRTAASADSTGANSEQYGGAHSTSSAAMGRMASFEARMRTSCRDVRKLPGSASGTCRSREMAWICSATAPAEGYRCAEGASAASGGVGLGCRASRRRPSASSPSNRSNSALCAFEQKRSSFKRRRSGIFLPQWRQRTGWPGSFPPLQSNEGPQYFTVNLGKFPGVQRQNARTTGGRFANCDR